MIIIPEFWENHALKPSLGSLMGTSLKKRIIMNAGLHLSVEALGLSSNATKNVTKKYLEARDLDVEFIYYLSTKASGWCSEIQMSFRDTEQKF